MNLYRIRAFLFEGISLYVFVCCAFTIRHEARLFNIQIDAGLLLKLQMVGEM